MSSGSSLKTWPLGRVLFILVGVMWIILGLLVLDSPFIAGLALVWVFGVLLVVGGVLHTIHAFLIRNWRGFLFFLLEGLLCILVGALLWDDPIRGVIGLTLLIGIFLLVGGVIRTVLAIMLRRSGAWVAWLLISAVLEIFLGVLILSQWPGSATWVIGVFLGIRMLFAGTSMISLGVAPRDMMAPV